MIDGVLGGITLLLGMLLLVAFVVCGVFVLASPEARAREPDD